MSDIAVAVQLGTIIQQINRYAPIFLFLFGVIGNLLICLLLTQRTLRSNPCCVYFIAASSLNVIVLTTAYVPRIIDGWNIKLDLTETISGICKFTLFLLFSTRSITAWMIALATVERYLISSPNIHRRQMSNLKNTYRCILLICIVSFIVWIEIFFCFDVNSVETPLKCYTKSNVCDLYNNFANVLIVSIIPITVMLVFGFCTIRNIRQTGRVAPNNAKGTPILRNRRNQNSLTKMLLAQVLTIILLTLPLSIITFYSSFTFYQKKSLTQNAIESFLFNIIIEISFIPNCISFILYIFSGSLFRETFIDMGKKTVQYLRCFHQHIIVYLS